MSVLSAPRFHDPHSALAHVEAVLWPNGPVCPHCGAMDRIYDLKGKSTKPGVRKCGHCVKLFSVTVGTIMESSHVPLNKWLQAVHLLCSSKKGISSHQLHRILEVTYKTAWFMSHRIREAMREGSLDVFGSNGGAVGVDQTFIGNDRTIKPKGQKKGCGYAHEHKVLALVDPDSGKTRSMVVDSLNANDLTPILCENIAAEACLMTDEVGQCVYLADDFAEHGEERHGRSDHVSQEDCTIHTNTIESEFLVFKRGMKGAYQLCAKKYLHRYLAEFGFRYNRRTKLGADDSARAGHALAGMKSRRLTYKLPRC